MKLNRRLAGHGDPVALSRVASSSRSCPLTRTGGEFLKHHTNLFVSHVPA
jgi:hypothetical protein